MPKYSFIVPVYNCGKYLVPCVESLLAQTEQDFEILLIDDGTPDDGGTVCDDYAEKYECIRVFHKENGGAASARNVGIDQARGKFLLFIDGDDTIEPDTLAGAEGAPACDLVIFGMAFDYYDKDGALQRTENLSCQLRGTYDKDSLNGRFRSLFDDNVLSSACNKVFSAEIIRERGLRFPEEMTLYEDMDFVLRYLAFTDTIYGIPKAQYHYRIDAESFGNKRVHQLERLQFNLHRLGETMLGMCPMPQDAPVLMADLYMQFLLRHMLVNEYRPGKMEPVYRYCEDPVFRQSLDLGGQVSGQEGMLLEMIDDHREKELAAWLRKKKINTMIRKNAKRILRMLGLRR